MPAATPWNHHLVAVLTVLVLVAAGLTTYVFRQRAADNPGLQTRAAAAEQLAGDVTFIRRRVSANLIFKCTMGSIGL
jgi:hypothetical protein